MTARTWTLVLPWLQLPLSANRQLHYAQRAAAVKQIRRDVFWLATQSRLPKGLPHALITLHWQPAVKRGRDEINLYPTLKAAVDGLVLGKGKTKGYGLTADDTPEYITDRVRIEPVASVARFWLTITETEARE
jgi:crossover junction endodeoxyribonuclease RusA